MDQADLNAPEWKQPELKATDPELVVGPSGTSSTSSTSSTSGASGTSGAFSVSGDCLEPPVPSDTGDSADLASISKPEIPQRSRLNALTIYMLENESQFYWLSASALLTWLGVWFHDTHGMLTWSSGPISFLSFVISLSAPLACILILFCQPNRYERPLLTLASFVSMLFWNQVPTVSFFALMLFRFKGASRTLGIVVLTGLQIGVFFLYPFFFGPIEELDHLQTADHNLSLRQVTVNSEHRCTLALMEEFPIAPLVNFGKIHWRLKDTSSPESAAILPIDSNHVAVLINRFSHYHRTVVDLTVKNLPIYVETMPAEK